MSAPASSGAPSSNSAVPPSAATTNGSGSASVSVAPPPTAAAASAASAPTAHVHDDYAAHHCPRPPSLHPKLDMHTHILPEHLPDLAARYGYGDWIRLEHSTGPGAHSCCAAMYKGAKFFRQVEANCFRAEERIKDMDEQNINVQVLSTVPVMFSYQAKPEDTLDLAKYLNDHIAGVCRQHPTRFVGLGTIPMQSVEHAIPELRRCMLELGMVGIQIGSHVNSLMLGDAKLAPIFEEAERLGACIFIHPWDMAGESMMQKYWLPWLVGMPIETGAAICSLMLSGTFARLPNLRVMFAHGGGSFPGTIGRIEHGYHCRPDLVAIDSPQRSPREWMGSFWCDSLVHDPVALAQLVNLVGPERVAFGTDYPFPLGEIHMGSLIAHMDQEQVPDEHAKPGAPALPSPLHADERAKWTAERKERLLWRNGLEFLGLEHQEHRFLRDWTAKPHPHTHPELLPAPKKATEATGADAAAASLAGLLLASAAAKP